MSEPHDPAVVTYRTSGTPLRDSLGISLGAGAALGVAVWLSSGPAWWYLGALAAAVAVFFLDREGAVAYSVDGEALRVVTADDEQTVPLARIDHIELEHTRYRNDLWVVVRYSKLFVLPAGEEARPFLRALFERLPHAVQIRSKPPVPALMGVGTVEDVTAASELSVGYQGWIERLAGRKVSVGKLILVYLALSAPVLVFAVSDDSDSIPGWFHVVAVAYWFVLVPWWFHSRRRR